MSKKPKSYLSEAHEEAHESLSRVQGFDAESLVRKDELGAKFQFGAAVEPANRVKSIFEKLPISALAEFPDSELNKIKAQSDNAYNIYSQILEFDPAEADAATRRQTLISQLESQYQPIFTALHPFISFAVARTVDWDRLSADGRAAVQAVRDETAKVMKEINETSENAAHVLRDVREAAAEQGVTQQAIYFEKEAENHTQDGAKWLVASICMGGVVLSYSVLTLFFPNIELFQADTVAGAIQLTASKILVFFVLAYLMYQCVRIYSAHRHNSVANKHRQNALMTYTTLAEAGSSVEARDTILQHAAAAIYAPTDTGYIKHDERGYGGNPVLGFSPKANLGSSQAAE